MTTELTEKQKAFIAYAAQECFLDGNSLPLIPRIKADAPEIGAVISEVLSKLNISPDLQPTYREARIRNLKCLILNLYARYLEGPHRWVGFARKRDKRQPKAFDTYKLSGNVIVDLIDELERLALVRQVIGLRGNKGLGIEGRQSRVQATDKLFSILAKHGADAEMIQSGDRPEIILREAKQPDKRQPPRLLTEEEVEILAAVVRRINDLLARSQIELRLPLHVQLADEQRRRENPFFRWTLNGTRYCRIFNGDYCHGGRWYGHWCLSIPSGYRKHIFINGEPTVEPDFGRMHPAMAYAMVKAEAPAGLYSYPGCAPGDRERLIRKVLLNCLLNANTPQAAYGGAMGCLRDKHDIHVTIPYLAKLAKALRKHHAPIREHFGSGLGLKLQYRDSQIATAILLDLADAGIPCLPVHDSFIVAAQHEDRLRALMDYHYRDQVGAAPIIK